MKKLIYFFAGMLIILVTIIACEKQSAELDEIQAIQEETTLSAKDDKAPKVTICHYDKDLDEYYSITISANGLSGHDGHVALSEENKGDILPEYDENTGEYIPLTDTDGDGILDCADCYPDDPTMGEKMKWYEDADGDGYGNPDVYIETCEVRDGYVADNTDCDDTDAMAFPYSPVGDFVAISSGYSQWDMSITYSDGINFVGTAGFPAGADSYTYFVELTGTVIDGVFYGEIAFGNPGQHDLTGTVSECEGVDHLDYKWVLKDDVNDYDGDGYFDNVDCDDSDPLINPKTMWYPDTDGDGYGDGNATPVKFNKATNGCDTTGYVLDNTDCDDTNASVNPGAPEICGDGIDNNCNGEIDENAYSPVGTYTVYKDNGAWYTFTIDTYDTINDEFTGSGYGRNVDGVEYSDLQVTAVVQAAPDMSLTIYVWVDGNPGVTKDLEGTVSECDGISEITTAHYSLTPFNGVVYTPL